jgi:adenosine deaminase
VLEYPSVKAGLILMLDREFPRRLNEIIYEKAKKYQHRGVVGIDVAGPQSKKFKIEEYKDLFVEAKELGFGVTIHTGEEGSLKEMSYIIREIQPHRIGHGFMAWKDPAVMKDLVEHGVTLELCPQSNLNVGVIKSIAEMKKIYGALMRHRVKLTINTDGPEMHGTNLRKELEFLKAQKIFTATELQQCIDNAFDASFIK